MAILCDGTVVPCCLDGNGVMALGNILDSTLEEILSNPRSVAIYGRIQEKDCGRTALYALQL